MQLDFDKMDGLIPAIVQDHKTNEVLMVGFVNQESYEATLRSGFLNQPNACGLDGCAGQTMTLSLSSFW